MLTKRHQIPPLWQSTVVVVAISIAWAWLRLWAFQDSLLPLTYVLPLLLCVWTRRRWHLWGMAAAFTGMASAKVFLILPAPVFSEDFPWTSYVATLVNIIVGSVVVEAILLLRERLDARAEEIEKQNVELEAQAEELSQQNEEIRAQTEELAQQNEEIEAQGEELSRQNEELQETNLQLARREEVLQAAVESSRTPGGGSAALEEVCRRALVIVGQPAGALAVVEERSDRVHVRAQAAADGHSRLPESWPIAGSLAHVALEHGKTVYVDDLRERPDLAQPLAASGYFSTLATPMRVGGRNAGAVIVCSRTPGHWTQDQFHLVEWAAAQCGLIVESLQWQDALQQRAEAVEAANRAKDEFLAMLSHELRTPLTPVLAAASTLEHDARLPEDARADLGMIRRNVSVQSRLIDDLLDLTRIARGKVDLNSQIVDVASLLRETAAIVQSDVQAREQSVVLESDLPSHCAVIGDTARLQQVFWNLLKNAVKFGPQKGRIVLSARMAPHTENSAARNGVGKMISISVADEGAGIDAADLERIFLPFEQAALSPKRGGNGGLGLGLSIAKAITELHDGRIRVASPGLGQGAVFTVELPLAEVPAPAESAKDSPAANAITNGESKSAYGVSATPLRILLVEDHRDTGHVLTRVLERSGHRVKHATSVAEALNFWSEDAFHLVLSDLGLPDGTGLDLMRKIRAMKADVAGICMSGFGMDADVQASRQAGFVEHLIKPVDVHKLRAAVSRFAERTLASRDGDAVGASSH